MKKVLLANGCSHTSGAEIEFSRQSFCYDKAWPKHLSNILGYDYINLAEAGGSNQRIIRTTQNWIIKNVLIEKKFEPKQLCVIIMWSGFDRKEIYVQKTNQMFNYCPSMNMDYVDEELKTEFGNYQKVETFFQDYVNVSNEFYISLINFHSFLEFNDIESYYINGFFHNAQLEDVSKTHALHQNYVNLVDYINLKLKKSFMGLDNINDTYLYHMKFVSGINQPEHSIHYHWGSDGHEYWAKTVYDYFFKTN